MKFSVLLFFAFLLFKTTQAQFLEKIFLKDSVTVYTGWIVEQSPQNYIKILRSKEKDTIQVQSEDVWKIIRIINTKSLKPSVLNSSPKTDKSLFIEGLGNGILYSVNYDTRLKKGVRDGWGLRAGLGYFKISAKDTVNGLKGYINITTIPVLITYLIGKKRGALELGIGGTIVLVKLKKLLNYNGTDINNLIDKPLTGNAILPSSFIGYRYTTLKNNLIFRGGISPFIDDGHITIFPGISIGYNFNKRISKSLII